jgi:hypothetical protein
MSSFARVLFVSACSVLAAQAQTTFASITGSVVDPNGLVVAGAEITATNSETNYRYSAKSNESGVYTLPQLREGACQVTVRATGFKEFVANDITLIARDVRRLDVKLELGSLEAKVEVSSQASLIETETARISDTKSGALMNTLPYERDPLHYLNQAAGVNALTGTTSTATVRYAGSRTNQENEAVDGVTINNMYDSTFIGPLGNFMEWIGEMRVDMANNTAEFGTIGQFTLISKSGGNQLRGSVIDYYASGGTAARNPFSPTSASYTQHFPGVTLGGPILLPRIYNGRNKTFFFFSFEDTRGSAIQQLISPTVPLASWRTGDFSALAPATTIKDPFNNGAPFPGNVIPAARINPVSERIQSTFWPLPNFGNTSVLQSQNFRQTLTRPYDPSTFTTLRLDHRFSDRFTVYARYNWARSWSRPIDGNLPNTIGKAYGRRQNDGANLSATYVFRSNLLNEFRWGLGYNDYNLWPAPNGLALTSALGLTGLVPNIPGNVNGIPKINFSNLGLTSLTDSYDYRNPGFGNRVIEFQDHVSWFRGKHSVRVGVDIPRVGFNLLQEAADLFGSLTFSNTFTGFTYGDFLLGIPVTSSRSYPALERKLLRWAYDFYVTDSFKVTPRLTLDLGLRYELHPLYHQAGDLLSVFDIAHGAIVVPDGGLSKVSSLLPTSYVKVIGASAAGLPQTLVNTDKNNFAPRFGLAWRPLGNNTVIRAGFGVFYDHVPYAIGAAGIPFLINQPAFTNPATNPTVILPNIYPANAGGPSNLSLPGAVNPNLVTPYSMQYNVTVEHQRWGNGFRLSFIADNTRKGEYSYNYNQPIADNQLFINKARPFPNYPAISYYTNGAFHQYNSGEFEVRRATAKGLTYDFSYVLARDIADLERGQSPEDAYNRHRERAVWRDIPTHRITANTVYELPFGKGKPLLSDVGRAAHALIGGWYLTAVYIFHSGNFLTPQWTGADPTGTAYTTNSTPAQVTIRPNCVANPNVLAGPQTVNQWFNPTAFAAPALGAFGSCAKGVIKGPGINQLNAGTGKDFRIAERVKVRLELRAENVLNHANWSEPGLNITSLSQVGVITGVGGVNSFDGPGMRFLRYGARIEW